MHIERKRAGGPVVLGLLALAWISGPGLAHAQTSSPSLIIVPATGPVTTAPPARRSRAHLGLIISGAVVLGVGWIANIITGLPAGDDPFESTAEPEWDAFRLTSLVPIAGPWIQLAVKPTDFRNDYWGPWLIANGIWQGAGAALLIAGLATIGDEEVPSASVGGVRWTLLPSFGADLGGMTLAGTF